MLIIVEVILVDENNFIHSSTLMTIIVHAIINLYVSCKFSFEDKKNHIKKKKKKKTTLKTIKDMG